MRRLGLCDVVLGVGVEGERGGVAGRLCIP